jgi:hypothetical protein
VELINSWTPQPLPPGWFSAKDAAEPASFTGRSCAVYGRLFTNDRYRLYLQGSPLRMACWATLSEVSGIPIASDEAEQVAANFFPGSKAMVRWILPGLVLFELPDKPGV